eukprot:TRINITY_DN2436_c0_g2_i1.p1 TRINITY_DN2436_c0_g2~~TRINITY_DN2436_c0_g2_i1.p1  ORF type:complete len:179 (-),score=32.61 TRINITY_DN2436_c0_g2_i1:507-1043(-)
METYQTQDQRDDTTDKTEYSISPLTEGKWKSWIPKTTSLLQSLGSSKWMDEFAPAQADEEHGYWREIAEEALRKGKISVFEYHKEMVTEWKVIATIKKSIPVSTHLLSQVEDEFAVTMLLNKLKSLTNITNGASIEAYSKLLWSMKLKYLADVPKHIAKFERVTSHLKENKSLQTKLD